MINWLLSLKTDLLKQTSLFYLGVMAASAIIIVGTLAFMVDPNIKSLTDGWWLAWNAMSLVGFGDVVPTSAIGRLLTSVLLLMGIVFLALLNATVSAMFINKGVRQVEQEESVILQEIKRLHERLDQLESKK
jgi:voltage-gated potassium channel